MRHIFTILADAATAQVEGAARAGSMDSMSQLLSVLLIVMMLACGGYGIYCYIRLRRTYALFPNKFMYPGNCRPEDCVDVDGFIDYILPRVLILGILLIVFGIAYGLYYVLVQKSLFWVEIASMVLPVGVLIWYMLVQRKAYKQFW